MGTKYQSKHSSGSIISPPKANNLILWQIHFPPTTNRAASVSRSDAISTASEARTPPTASQSSTPFVHRIVGPSTHALSTIVQSGIGRVGPQLTDVVMCLTISSTHLWCPIHKVVKGTHESIGNTTQDLKSGSALVCTP